MLIKIWRDETQALSGRVALGEGESRRFEGWLQLLRILAELLEPGGASGASAGGRDSLRHALLLRKLAAAALPHRELSAEPEAPEGAVGGVTIEDGATMLDPTSVTDAADAADFAVPGLVDDAPTLTVVPGLPLLPELPARAVDPLDDEWRPQVAEDVAEDTAATDVTVSTEAPTDLPALLADEPDPKPTPETDGTDEAVEADGAVGFPALHEVDDVQAGSQARSTLSELARESAQQAPEETPAPDEAAPAAPAAADAPPVSPVPAVPVIPTGAAAMDILPTRSSGRGLHLRRTSRPKASSSSHPAPSAAPPQQQPGYPSAYPPASPVDAPTFTPAPVPPASPPPPFRPSRNPVVRLILWVTEPSMIKGMAMGVILALVVSVAFRLESMFFIASSVLTLLIVCLFGIIIASTTYFAALRSAILKAEHSVVIVGWDIDSRAPLRHVPHDDSPDPESEAPVDFREVQRSPQFQELRKRQRSFIFPIEASASFEFFTAGAEHPPDALTKRVVM